MNQSAKFLPINVQEHDNVLRTIAVKYMGTNQGNPSQWVVDALHEAYQSGFGQGFEAGAAFATVQPKATPQYRVQLPRGPIVIDERAPRRIATSPKALPLIDRIEDGEEDVG